MDKLFKDLYEFRKFMICGNRDIKSGISRYYLSMVPSFNDCLCKPLSDLIDPEGLFTKDREFNSTRFFQPEDVPYLKACKSRMDEFFNDECLTDLIYEAPYKSVYYSPGADPIESLNLIYKRYLSFVSTGMVVDRFLVKELVSDDVYEYFIDLHTRSLSDGYYSSQDSKVFYNLPKNIDRFLHAERAEEDLHSLLGKDSGLYDSPLECEAISQYDSLKKVHPNSSYIRRYTEKLKAVVKSIQPKDIYLLFKEYVEREYERVPKVFTSLNEDSTNMLDLLYDKRDKIKERLILNGNILYTTIHSVDIFWGLTGL